MNDLLQLKGHFESRKNPSSYGIRHLPGSNNSVSLEKLENLKSQLQDVINYWKDDQILQNKLISVYYIKLVAKSNRIQELFSSNTKSIVGAKFTDETPIKHIITHCISIDEMSNAIEKINNCIEILNENNWNIVTNKEIEDINYKIVPTNEKISKTSFIGCIIDAYYVERFGLELDKKDFSEPTIVTLYDTGIKTQTLLAKIGINYLREKILDDSTLYLSPEQYAILKSKAPYLIAMSVEDISKIEIDDVQNQDNISDRVISSPKNEPTIGVIDTPFDEGVYFKSWVDYRHFIDENISISAKDKLHGTYVSSIIVDGPALNPTLDDGCGHFKVRHFGIGLAKGFSIFSLIRNIQEIVATNTDIKVWNLSLGSKFEIEKNFVSPVGYLLDKIQYEYDVIFVVAGTNKTKDLNQVFIGSPADSINSLVVNSVDFENNSASYSRKGPVLSFYKKPDVSYYGGDTNNEITVYNGFRGETKTSGTSFAAPWIARKIAYLIHVMGLTREVAKALIIDSAIEWKGNDKINETIGYGIVPKKIDTIVQSQNDEIKFVIAGTTDNYITYNNNIPVPIDKGSFPFIAKATLCYFPNCSRNQGVDYTNTELDLQFGRVKEDGIKSINGNLQSTEGQGFVTEEAARKEYRKWDNVKIIREELKSRHIPRQVYQSNHWGIKLTSKERSTRSMREKTKFGIVITLKEMNGINRIEEFIQRCTFSQWLVNRINVENKIDLYVKADEEVNFE